MRAILCFFICWIWLSSIYGQVLNGKIINGIGEEGLSNVRVEVQGMATVFSDPQLGTFSLDLPGVRPGMKVPLDIQKEGYAVINREATQPYLPDNPLDRVKIHLAPIGERDGLALQFYKITVERNIEVNFETAAKRFAEEANYEAIGKLHKDKESALQLADSLAARLSRFDPQLATEEMTQAMQLYQNGKVQEALDILDAEKILTRIEGRKEVMADMEQANQQDIESLMKAGDMALTELQFAKAQQYYEAAVMADTTNLDHLMTLCTYLKRQYQILALVKYGRIMQRVSASNDYYRSTALGFIGSGLDIQKQHSEAILVFEEALQLRRKLAEMNPARYEPYVAQTLGNLGGVFRNQDRFADAIKAETESLNIYQRLAKENPQIFEPDLAAVYNALGVTNYDMQQFVDAIPAYEQALAIQRRLAKENPQRFDSELAMTLNNLGESFRQLKRYDDAIATLEETLEIRKRLAKENPQRFEWEVGQTLFNLGLAYQAKNRLEESLTAYKEALEILTRVSEKTEGFRPYAAMVMINMSAIFQRKLMKAPSSEDLEEGKKWVWSADSTLNLCPDVPFVGYLKQLTQELREFYQIDIRELELVRHSHAIKDSIKQSSSLSEKISFQQQLIEIYVAALEAYPEGPTIRRGVAQSLDSLASWQIQAGAYTEAESSVKKCVEIVDSYTQIHRWEAVALLLQGKFNAARQIYLAWSDKPWPTEPSETFREAFLVDLEKLEKSNITHPDMAKIRELLKE